MTQNRPRRDRRRVALFQPTLPHYRVDLFNEFDASIDHGLTLFTSAVTESPGMRGSEERSAVVRRRARTWRLGPTWFVPRTLGVVWSREHDAVVLSWNIRQLEILPALLIGRWRGVAVLLWGHGLGANRSGLGLWLRRAQARLAAVILTYSETGQRDVLTLAPRAPVRVLLNTTGRNPPTADQYLGVIRRRVVYLGRLDARKRVDRLVTALVQVAADGLSLDLDVVGEGPERRALEQEVHRLGVADRVHWHGHLPDWAATQAILDHCDLVILPSHAGLAVVDAFAAARPVLIVDDAAQNGPEAALVADGETGFRYSPATAEALAGRLRQIYTDPEALRHISERTAELYRERLTVDCAASAFAAAVAEATRTRSAPTG